MSCIVLLIVIPLALAFSAGLNYLLAMGLTWAIHQCGGPLFPVWPVAVLLWIAMFICGSIARNAKPDKD